MRVLVTGAGGMLARAVVREAAGRGHEVVALARAELDVTDRAAVARAVREVAPTVAVQCAAFTAVDDAESDPGSAHAVNALGTAALAAACHDAGASLVFPSTDYVFSGDADRPYRVDDPLGPINAYGRSKAAGEEAAAAVGALIVRTSWLYGSGGANFVDTIARRAAGGETLRVVDDQVGRPTWTGTLAGVMLELVERGARGVHHVTDGGRPVSWHGLASRLVAMLGHPADVVPVRSTEFPRPARRPRYSVLDCAGTEAALGRPLPDWEDVLAAYLVGH